MSHSSNLYQHPIQLSHPQGYLRSEVKKKKKTSAHVGSVLWVRIWTESENERTYSSLPDSQFLVKQLRKTSSAAIKTLFGVMRFHSSGLEAWSSLGLGLFFFSKGGWRESDGTFPPYLKEWFPQSLGQKRCPLSFHLPAPLTSLSPCLPASTIWSIFCLPASCSRKSPPWPPSSCLLSAPANNPSHHAKTHVHTNSAIIPQSPKPTYTSQSFQRGIDCSAVSRKGEMEIRGEGGKITGEWKACIARRNTVRQLLAFGITALTVLHAWEAPSIY